MRSISCILFFFLYTGMVYAQSSASHVRTGNRLYKEKKYKLAIPEYKRALAEQPSATIGNYNLGDAYFRTGKYDDAVKSFEHAVETANDGAMKQRAFYNIGVSYSRAKKLEESIAAYKSAVVLNPADSDARINLQKALLEQKMKNQPEKKKNEENKRQQKKKENEPPPSKLSKKQVEQLLKALQQREQQVQQKMQQNRARATTKPEKDW